MWKERGRGRLRMFERAWKDAEGVGRFRRRSAAMVCRGSGLATKQIYGNAYIGTMHISNIAPVHGIGLEHI